MSGEPTGQFDVTDRFDPTVMQDFMRRPDIYWASNDALMPPPEVMNFVEHMLHPDTWTVAATFQGHIIGYVKFVRRTSIMVEMVVGFHPQFRGRIARACVLAAIGQAFREKGFLKIVAVIPDDNKAALVGIRRLGAGFVLEGRLSRAIVREGRNPPIADLLIFGLSRGDVP